MVEIKVGSVCSHIIFFHSIVIKETLRSFCSNRAKFSFSFWNSTTVLEVFVTSYCKQQPVLECLHWQSTYMIHSLKNENSVDYVFSCLVVFPNLPPWPGFMPGKHSTADIHPWSLIFGDRVSLYPRLALNLQCACFCLLNAGVTGACHHRMLSAQPLIRARIENYAWRKLCNDQTSQTANFFLRI